MPPGACVGRDVRCCTLLYASLRRPRPYRTHGGALPMWNWVSPQKAPSRSDNVHRLPNSCQRQNRRSQPLRAAMAQATVMLSTIALEFIGGGGPCAVASEPNTAAGRTACSRHRRWRNVRRYDATGSSRLLPLRMDLWTKSRLRILLGVIGPTAVQHGRPRRGDPELPGAGGPCDRIHRIGRPHLPLSMVDRRRKDASSLGPPPVARFTFPRQIRLSSPTAMSFAVGPSLSHTDQPHSRGTT
jgi:hypothetical protein